MKQFETNKGKFIAVEVSEDAFRFSLIKNKELKGRYGHLEYTQKENGVECSMSFKNIEKYDIIGIAKDLNEEVWEKIVPNEKGNSFFSESGHCFYKNYLWKPEKGKMINIPVSHFHTAQESGKSLLEAYDISENDLILKINDNPNKMGT